MPRLGHEWLELCPLGGLSRPRTVPISSIKRSGANEIAPRRGNPPHALCPRTLLARWADRRPPAVGSESSILRPTFRANFLCDHEPCDLPGRAAVIFLSLQLRSAIVRVDDE